jgi:hypothetical protein
MLDVMNVMKRKRGAFFARVARFAPPAFLECFLNALEYSVLRTSECIVVN